MMSKISDTAMVLAAGFGTRLRPLTLTKPKPLFEVGGRTMLDHAIDKLVHIGMRRVVVNCHYLADQIEAHLQTRHDVEIVISREDEILETGGGIKKALPFFDGLPFFVLSADPPFFDQGAPSLGRMKEMWNAQQMDVLLLVAALEKAVGFGERGDFARDEDGRLWRQDPTVPRPYVMISAQITRPELFAITDEKTFSNNLIWTQAEKQKRLFGLLHQGDCYRVDRPDDLAEANRLLSSHKGN